MRIWGHQTQYTRGYENRDNGDRNPIGISALHCIFGESSSRATRAHRAALISVSVALSKTPAEAASPRTRG